MLPSQGPYKESFSVSRANNSFIHLVSVNISMVASVQHSIHGDMFCSVLT